MRKIIALTLSVVFIVSLLTGFTSYKKASNSKAKEVTLRFSWWGDDSRHKPTLDAIKKFEAKYPNIKIEAEYAGFTGYQDKQTTQIAGGTAADIMQINWNWLPIFSKDGNGFYDLNKFSKELGLASEYSKQSLLSGTVNGKLNAIPVSLTGRVLFFNQTTYDKNNVALPKTWEDLANAGQKFQTGSYPIVIGSYDAWLLAMTYTQQVTGKQFISNEGKLVFTLEDIKTALQFYKNLLDKKVTPSIQTITGEGGSGIAPIAQLPSFLTGKYSGVFEWTSAISKDATPLKDKHMKMVFGGLPIAKGAKNSGAILKPSMLFAINKDCKYPLEAATFLNYILNDPQGALAMGTSRGIPIGKTAVTALRTYGKITGLEYEGLQFLKAHPGVELSPYLEDARLQKIYYQTIDQLSYNKLDVNASAKYMFDEMQKTLEQITK
jgi:oligogalacturonide transport system substrate-binding protein